MEQMILSFLFLLSACLPALMFRPLRRKRFIWLFFLCAFVAAAFPASPLLFFIYALALGACLWFAVYKQMTQGKLLSFFLCWSGCVAVIDTGHFLHGGASTTFMAWVFLALALCVSIVIGLEIRWLSRWTFADSVPLSEERKATPIPLYSILLLLLLLLTLLGGRFPIFSAVCAVIFQFLALLIAALWNDMTLAIRHSQESSENSRQSRQAIDRASRSSEAELQRQLTESNNKLLQIRDAYRSNDQAALASLLDTPEDMETASYCAFPLLDAILRHCAYTARRSGLTPNFQLQLGSLQDFPLSDIGVLLDLMLGILSEYHPGELDTLRLRVQEWGDALIITAGRRDSLRSVPEDKMNALRQLTEERGGWVEFAEKENGICLSAVLFRPAAEE